MLSDQLKLLQIRQNITSMKASMSTFEALIDDYVEVIEDGEKEYVVEYMYQSFESKTPEAKKKVYSNKQEAVDFFKRVRNVRKIYKNQKEEAKKLLHPSEFSYYFCNGYIDSVQGLYLKVTTNKKLL